MYFNKQLTLSLVFIILFINLTGCHSKSKNIRLKPLRQDNFIQVYFNHNQAEGAEYIEPYRKIKRKGDNLEEIMINQINSANYTIDLAVQELNLPKVAKALIARHKVGVKIRIIVENTYNIPVSKLNANNDTEVSRYNQFMALADSNKDGILSKTEINQSDALVILKNAGIPLIDDSEDGSKGSGLMHHKFMVIDNQKVITGSANFTFSGIHGDFTKAESRGNTNHILVIDNQKLAKIFTAEFNYMWGDGLGGENDSLFGIKKPDRFPENILFGDSLITVKFSPNSRSKSWTKTTNGLIGKTLQSSLNSVDLALFVFSDQELANILEKRHQEGVQIRALIDKKFAFQYYSEALDLLGVALTRKCRYENNNNPWKKPINTVGISNLSEGDKLHHKFAIIDNSKVITGSHNWSASANYTNDETLLIIDNPTVAKHFNREFARLYQNSTLGIPIDLHQTIQDARQKCQIN
jgi:phosphatidylserine/phosphatidylglycerophosphate/cardiolipin synthase-like enzyme